MKARFIFVEFTEDTLVIRDIGRKTDMSVTNDAEAVVESLRKTLGDRRLLCYDSLGKLTELLVDDGEFVGFAPGNEP